MKFLCALTYREGVIGHTAQARAEETGARSEARLSLILLQVRGETSASERDVEESEPSQVQRLQEEQHRYLVLCYHNLCLR